MSSFTPLVFAAAFAGVLLIGTQSVRAGSPVFVGTKSSQHVGMDQIDHSLWDSILKKYVDADGLVDYPSLKASSADTQQLDRYLAVLSSASPVVAAKRESKLAFWINAYNAVTIRGVLREYPTTSIRNHTARLFGYNIWKVLQLYVGTKPHSLEQIEHEVLRKMSEPRIHFAIVCASIGCPRLLNEAYVGDRVEQQLQANAIDFFSRNQNFRYDNSGQRFYLSAIMKWFASDFGADQSAQLKRISEWLPTKDATDAANRNSVSISYLDYDWALNKQ